MTYTRQGVRYQRLKAVDHAYGHGKVHLMVWRRDWKLWVAACLFQRAHPPFGTIVDDTTEVTCKRCIDKMTGNHP